MLVLEENVFLSLLEPLETIMVSAKMVRLFKHHISPRRTARGSSVSSGTGRCSPHLAISQRYKFCLLVHFGESFVEDLSQQFYCSEASGNQVLVQFRWRSSGAV